MAVNADLLKVINISGNSYNCGIEYGETLSTLICGFFNQEIKPTDKKITYARKCWEIVKKNAPHSTEFIRGVAQTSGLNISQLVMLLLHEELIHQQHCSGFVIAPELTEKRTMVVAQNWDWPTKYYPWPSLLKMKLDSGKTTLTYNYPGLWSACGINSGGLSLMWTGSGYRPLVKPIVGIPTYILIAEILQLETVAEALSYLNKIKYAGSFIFLLGDATGDTCVVEAIPNHHIVKKSPTFICRTNFFVDLDMIKKSRQIKDQLIVKTYRRLNKLLTNHLKEKITNQQIRDFLRDRPKVYNMEPDHMTTDSFYTFGNEGTLWTARGGYQPGSWQSVNI